MTTHKENCQKLYEDNYRKLVIMLPDIDYVEHVTLSSDSHILTVTVDVIERTKYTVLLELNTFYEGSMACMLQPMIQVRVYHDAQVAEVLAVQGKRRIKPHYEYPNKSMFLPDEKQQGNKMLFEMLSFCGRNKFKKSYNFFQIEVNE
ncbi:MAG: DUF1249 domain-containing protein [Gammaproteobacteria bacterium]|nr:DUF1249 domain-containing protein [Gammaproteobacteria bacterium]